MSMQYVFTSHAKARMNLRNISYEDVVKTIEYADVKELETNSENKIAYYRKISKELALKVVTAKSENTIRIITVHHINIHRLKQIKNLIEV